MLAGEVVVSPETRHSPAGIPLTRFTLEHRSQQTEAGLPREAFCRIIVVCAGEELKNEAQCLALGQQLTVSGFLARADSRQGQSFIVLHAQSLRCNVKQTD